MADKPDLKHGPTDQSRLNRRFFMNRSAVYGLTAALGTSMLPAGAWVQQDPRKTATPKIDAVGGKTTVAREPGLPGRPVAGAQTARGGDAITTTLADAGPEARLEGGLLPDDEAST